MVFLVSLLAVRISQVTTAFFFVSNGFHLLMEGILTANNSLTEVYVNSV